MTTTARRVSVKRVGVGSRRASQQGPTCHTQTVSNPDFKGSEDLLARALNLGGDPQVIVATPSNLHVNHLFKRKGHIWPVSIWLPYAGPVDLILGGKCNDNVIAKQRTHV